MSRGDRSGPFSGVSRPCYALAALLRIVIVGGGQVGASLARALSADHEVVVVDQDPHVEDVFQSIDVEFLLGSGTNEEVLARAGVAGCGFFVAATGLDEVNIVACALANRLGQPQTICLVSRAEFLDSAGAGGGLAAFGVNRVIWPEAQLAADIERIVTAPGAIDAEVFAGGVMRLLEYRLDEGSALTSGPVEHPAPASRRPDRGSQTCGAHLRATRHDPAGIRRQGDRDGDARGHAGGRGPRAPRTHWRAPAGDNHRRR